MNINYIHQHLGLGDHLICNGLIRNLIRDYDKTYLFVKHHNLPSVQFMFRDLSNLELIAVNDDFGVNDYISKNNLSQKLTIIGHHNTFCCGPMWDENFYKSMNVDHQKRWTDFYVERDFIKENNQYEKLNPNDEKYALIHNKHSGGLDGINYDLIGNNLKRIFVEQADTIFDYLKLIDNAEEVHCVNSSFFHLVDLHTTTPNQNLVFHKNYKSRDDDWGVCVSDKWKVI
jgi:hypothetical protein